jgi:FMN-dependent NADH-azoreductase
MPAILKAYIDLIVKVWVTFNMWENGYVWLVNNVKNIYLVWAKWWVYKWQPWESIDMLESTVKQAFAFIGITNAKTFWLEWVNSWSDEELNNKINEIKSEIDKSL